MDAAPWPQDVKIGKTMESEISSSECTRNMIERKAKPEEQLNCPRCNSTNTKFCYYNNYSLTQPRYFCKTCRRYWTAGGSLRNVPVGGGSRKNKRSSSSSSSANSNSSKLPDLNPPNLSHFSPQNPKSFTQGQDLNLAFPAIQDTQAMEMLGTRGLNSYIAGYPMPTLSFPQEENGGKILFPFGELKQQLSIPTHHHHHVEIDRNKGEDEGGINNTGTTSAAAAGFWNGMFGHGNGGSW